MVAPFVPIAPIGVGSFVRKAVKQPWEGLFPS